MIIIADENSVEEIIITNIRYIKNTASDTSKKSVKSGQNKQSTRTKAGIAGGSMCYIENAGFM